MCLQDRTKSQCHFRPMPQVYAAPDRSWNRLPGGKFQRGEAQSHDPKIKRAPHEVERPLFAFIRRQVRVVWPVES